MELANIIVNGILGLAVVVLTWRTITLTKQSIQHEKDLRKREVDIALFDKRYEVLSLLNNLVFNSNNYNDSLVDAMQVKVLFLFPTPLNEKLMLLFLAISDFYDKGEEPSEYIEKYSSHELMKDKVGVARAKQSFYLEYTFISYECSPIMVLNNDHKIEIPKLDIN